MDEPTACLISIAFILFGIGVLTWALFGIGVLTWALVLALRAWRTKGEDVPAQSRKARNESLSLITVGLAVVVVGMSIC